MTALNESQLKDYDDHGFVAPITILSSEEVARSLMIPPPLIGLGLLEAIPENDILINEDINDGISCKANRVKDENGIESFGQF